MSTVTQNTLLRKALLVEAIEYALSNNSTNSKIIDLLVFMSIEAWKAAGVNTDEKETFGRYSQMLTDLRAQLTKSAPKTRIDRQPTSIFADAPLRPMTAEREQALSQRLNAQKSRRVTHRKPKSIFDNER
jgi:hypothetical protein